jgi:hypothetical protein
LIVYASTTRGEEFDGNKQRIELFAKIHRVPILVISDMDVHRFGKGTGEFGAADHGQAFLGCLAPLRVWQHDLTWDLLSNYV